MNEKNKEPLARPTKPKNNVVETRSIDYIPLDERHGKSWHQGPFWFTSNFQLVTAVTGFIGPSLGLSAGWAILAVAAGAAIGSWFVAFHANQGPTFGLPQMLQSRAQFGLRGAILPFLAAIVFYVGFNVFDLIVATNGIQTVLPGSNNFWFILLTLVALTIAIIGHDFMHLIQRWLMPPLILIFLILSFGVIATKSDAIFSGGDFDATAFLAAFGAAAGYQLGYAIYVSDYSRYLPREVSAKNIILGTYIGITSSAVWLMGLGALLASAFEDPSIINAIQSVGNSMFAGFGTFIVFVSALPLIMIITVNAYGAMLTGMSVLEAFRPIAITIRTRVIGLVIVTAASLCLAIFIPSNYLSSYLLFLTFIVYLLVPWTSVNLVDFYFIRRGHYDVDEIVKRNGIYGQWSSRGLVSYVLGFISMVPFFSTSAFIGPAAKMLGGADISFFVGLAVSGLIYYVIAQDIKNPDRAS